MAGQLPRLRPCDGCTACCTVLAIDEVPSAAGCDCPHLSGGGCATYATRPETCRGFACGWAAGMVPGPLRPDRCGVLQWMDGDTVHVRELTEGALDGWWTRRIALWELAFDVVVA